MSIRPTLLHQFSSNLTIDLGSRATARSVSEYVCTDIQIDEQIANLRDYIRLANEDSQKGGKEKEKWTQLIQRQIFSIESYPGLGKASAAKIIESIFSSSISRKTQEKSSVSDRKFSNSTHHSTSSVSNSPMPVVDSSIPSVPMPLSTLNRAISSDESSSVPFSMASVSLAEAAESVSLEIGVQMPPRRSTPFLPICEGSASDNDPVPVVPVSDIAFPLSDLGAPPLPFAAVEPPEVDAPPYVDEDKFRHQQVTATITRGNALGSIGIADKDFQDFSVYETTLTHMLAKRCRERGIPGEMELRAQIDPALRPASISRQVWDLSGGVHAPLVRLLSSAHGENITPDLEAQTAFENMKKVDTFFREVFYENPVNNMHTRMRSYVHDSQWYNNACWAPFNCFVYYPDRLDQTEAVHFGDVDPDRQVSGALILDTVAHEFGHSLVSASANFRGARENNFEAGALNESIGDIFAIMVKHYQTKTLANHPDASWLYGEGRRVGAEEGNSMRSLKAPGTAYRNHFGTSDTQERHYSKYKFLGPNQIPGPTNDWGHVHKNCSIPNHAFYLAATEIGGYTYGIVGKIWHRALMSAKQNDTFSDFALRTLKAAKDLDDSYLILNAVGKAWLDVGVDLKDQFPPHGVRPPEPGFWSFLFGAPTLPPKMLYHISRSQLIRLDANTRERVNQAFRAGHLVGVDIEEKEVYALDSPTPEVPISPTELIGHLPD